MRIRTYPKIATTPWNSGFNAPPPPIKSPKYYQTCSELPLSIFIAVSVTNQFSLLTIEGLADEGTTKCLWASIYAEYLSLVDDEASKIYINQLREISIIQAKCLLIEKITTTLLNVYSPELVVHLRSMGYDFEFNPDDEGKYLHDIVRVINRSKHLVIELNAMLTAFNKQNDSRAKEPITQSYFDEILIVLSKEQGYFIDAEKISAAKFAIMQKCLSQKIKSLNK